MFKNVKQSKLLAAVMVTGIAAAGLTGCAPKSSTPTALENGASDISTGFYRIQDKKKNETYDVTVTRYVDSISPINPVRKIGNQSRFVAVKMKVVNKLKKEVDPQWVLDDVVLVDNKNKLYSPVYVGGEASDGSLEKKWSILPPESENQTYLTYEVGYDTQIDKVKINLPNYPEAEWKVNVSMGSS